ncbi:unnamed protein product, partial [Closterium sp. NIES-54]
HAMSTHPSFLSRSLALRLPAPRQVLADEVNSCLVPIATHPPFVPSSPPSHCHSSPTRSLLPPFPLPLISHSFPPPPLPIATHPPLVPSSPPSHCHSFPISCSLSHAHSPSPRHVLADEVNSGFERLAELQVKRVNGKEVENLRQLRDEVLQCTDGFVRFDLDDDRVIAVSVSAAKKASAQILRRYRVPCASSWDLQQGDTEKGEAAVQAGAS